MSIFLEMLEMKEPEMSPLLLEILLSELPKCAERKFTDQQTGDYIANTYLTVMEKTITTQQALAILSHLIESVGSAPGQEPEAGAAPSNKRYFSSSFARFLDGMELDDSCFVLANMDPAKAKEIYRYHDYRLVKAMRSTWQQMEMQKAQVQLEAAVYGMGGSFDDEDCEVYDLTTGDYSADELNRMINLH